MNRDDQCQDCRLLGLRDGFAVAMARGMVNSANEEVWIAVSHELGRQFFEDVMEISWEKIDELLQDHENREFEEFASAHPIEGHDTQRGAANDDGGDP